jgi:amino acid adenylation domain-containing protein
MIRLLQEWVAGQAQARPQSPAVAGGGSRLTYGELDTLSTQIARVLIAAGCRQGDRVALLMPSSPAAMATLFGIYKADCIYVPLDPASPVSRLEKILESCANRWVLAAGPVMPVLEQLFQSERWRERLKIGWLQAAAPASRGVSMEFTLADVIGQPTSPVPAHNHSCDPAHILFTSGSTGIPKGVVLTHANVIAFIDWATKYFGMHASDRACVHPPLHFDMSMLDIFSMAAVGGQLHLVPREFNLLPKQLAEFIRSAELTQWYSVPPILNYLAKFDAVRANDFPALRRVIWAGDVLPTPALIYWMNRLPHVQFTNLYGPTETAISSSYYTVPAVPEDPTAAIPIGRACAGEELLVLDESLQPVPAGEIGDLYIGGAGVSLGYWRDPQRTAAAFLPHPQRPSERIYKTGDLGKLGGDGEVYFLGRSDSQIKSRGYRIELGEIETALNAVPGVLECAVVPVRTTGFEGVEICCAYVAAADSGLTPTSIRRQLARMVPAYMLPSRWQSFDRFPRNASGKIDRRRLKDLFEEPTNLRAAQSA